MQITVFNVLFNVACFLVAMIIWEIVGGTARGMIYVIKYFFAKKPDPAESEMPLYGPAAFTNRTVIESFEVIEPTHELETKGAYLKLSVFGIISIR